MKYFFILLFFLVINAALAQDQIAKISVYMVESGRVYNKWQKDSLWYKANQFVKTKVYKETRDSVYYSLKHYDKSLLIYRYKTDGSYCLNTDPRKQSKEIKKLPPFDRTSVIKLVSFKSADLVEGEIPLQESGKADLAKMYEIETANEEQINILMDVLMNYDNQNRGEEVVFCYNPRNAIIFFDKENNEVCHIEICFECWKYKTKPYMENLGNLCHEALDIIQSVFMNAGIKFGITEKEE